VGNKLPAVDFAQTNKTRDSFFFRVVLLNKFDIILAGGS